jgi:hypothetical protein
VLTASNGAGAVKRYEYLMDPVDLVVSDLVIQEFNRAVRSLAGEKLPEAG